MGHPYPFPYPYPFSLGPFAQGIGKEGQAEQQTGKDIGPAPDKGKEARFDGRAE